MKYKFTLSIGFPTARREEIIDIKDYGYDLNEWSEMTSEDRERELQAVWSEWSNNFIDGGWEEI